MWAPLPLFTLRGTSEKGLYSPVLPSSCWAPLPPLAQPAQPQRRWGDGGLPQSGPDSAFLLRNHRESLAAPVFPWLSHTFLLSFFLPSCNLAGSIQQIQLGRALLVLLATAHRAYQGDGPCSLPSAPSPFRFVLKSERCCWTRSAGLGKNLLCSVLVHGTWADNTGRRGHLPRASHWKASQTFAWEDAAYRPCVLQRMETAFLLLNTRCA